MTYAHAGTLNPAAPAYGRTDPRPVDTGTVPLTASPSSGQGRRPRSALEGIRAVELAENLPPSQRLEPMPFDYSRATGRRVWLFDPSPRKGRPPLILRWSWRWEGGRPA